MHPRSKGMLPGEYMKVGLVQVKDPNVLDGEITIKGDVERRPEFYVVIVRRFEGEWTVEVQATVPLTTGVWPDAVVTRIGKYQDRIIAEQRRDRGIEQAEARRFPREVLDEDEEEELA